MRASIISNNCTAEEREACSEAEWSCRLELELDYEAPLELYV